MTDLAAIILAAGRSQRMGAFKPLLPFGDKTVIDHSVDNLSKAGLDNIVVVVGQDPRAEELRRHLENSAVSFAVNPDPLSEMSSSIACGVQALAETVKAVVILPVDHPAVPFEVVAELIDEWRKGTSLVVPSWSGRGGHPVLIDLCYRNELITLDTDRGLRSLFDTHRDQVKRLPVTSSFIARDMDTWDDYAALHKDVFGFLPAKLKPEEPR
jgi:molybdenum cofactor cytidylyltransferase